MTKVLLCDRRFTRRILNLSRWRDERKFKLRLIPWILLATGASRNTVSLPRRIVRRLDDGRVSGFFRQCEHLLLSYHANFTN